MTGEQPSPSEAEWKENEARRRAVTEQAFLTMGINLDLVRASQEQRTTDVIGATPGIGFIFESLVFSDRMTIPPDDEEEYIWTVDVTDPNDRYWTNLYKTWGSNEKEEKNELVRDEAQYLIGGLGIDSKVVVLGFQGENKPENAFLRVVERTSVNTTSKTL